jgi:hypothetical protein
MSATEEQTKPDVLTRELWQIAGSGNVERLEQILAQGADVNAGDRTGVTPLMRAAYHGELPMVRALIEHGADLDAKDSGGLTALMMAKHSGRAEIVEALLSSGAKENSRRRVHKILPVEPETEEAAPVEPETEEAAPVEPAPGEIAGAITNKNPAIRTLHEPPEIWEMVHTTEPPSQSQTGSKREFPSARKFPSARTLILAASVVIVAVGAVFGFLLFRRSGSANVATPRPEVSVSQSKAPASPVNQRPTKSIQNVTPYEPPRAASQLNQQVSIKPSGKAEGLRTSGPSIPLAAPVAMSVKKPSANPREQRVKNGAADNNAPQKSAARVAKSSSDKSANSAALNKEAVKTPGLQPTVPAKTNAPKPKVIQWP